MKEEGGRRRKERRKQMGEKKDNTRRKKMIKEGGMAVAMVTGLRRSLGSWVCPYKLYSTGNSSIIKEDVPPYTQAFTENRLKPKCDP